MTYQQPYYQPPPQKRSSTTWWIVGGCGAILVLVTLCACGLILGGAALLSIERDTSVPAVAEPAPPQLPTAPPKPTDTPAPSPPPTEIPTPTLPPPEAPTPTPETWVTIDGYDSASDSIIDPINLWNDYDNRLAGIAAEARHGDQVKFMLREGDGVLVETADGVQGWVTYYFIKEFK